MRRFFSALVLLAIGVAVLGYFRDWYTVSATENPLSDRVDVSVHIDRSKIRYDARQAKEAARSLRREVAEIFEDREETSLPDLGR